MSYQGVFYIDDSGIRLSVNVPGDGIGVRSLIVSFTFEQLQTARDARLLVHGVIARRVVDATRSLDEED